MIKDVVGLARWICWLLIADVIIGAAAIISGVMEYRFLADIQAGVYSDNPDIMALAEANDLRQMVIGLTRSVALIVAGIDAHLVVPDQRQPRRQASTV